MRIVARIDILDAIIMDNQLESSSRVLAPSCQRQVYRPEVYRS